VADAALHQPVYVPAETSLHEAALRMDEAGQRALLIEVDGRTGIVTDVDLTRAGVRDRAPLDTPIRDIAHFELKIVDPDEPLAEAALLMARQRVRHLVVRRDDKLEGILDAAAVLASLGRQAAVVAR
jgi:CBS domain-containing protein